MARVNLPLTEIARAGVAPGAEVNGDAVNNHEFSNDGRVFLLVRNSGAGARTVTFKFQKTVDGQAVTSRAVAMGAGVSRYFGPFPVVDYGSTPQVDVEHAELKLTAYHLGAA